MSFNPDVSKLRLFYYKVFTSLHRELGMKLPSLIKINYFSKGWHL